MSELFLQDCVELRCGDCREVLRGLADGSIDSVVTDPPYSLVSIIKRFGNTSESDETVTSERVRSRADSYACLAAGGFMGKKWDTGEVAFDPAFWADVLRVLKPGGHVLAMGGTRTFHRLACAIEDAGFEIRDCVMWVYGTGFPKSHDVSKGIDKGAGAERELVKPRSVIAHQRNIGNTRPYMDDPDHMTVSDVPATDAARQWQGWGTALKPSWEPCVLARKPLSEKTVAANVLAHGTGALNIDACRVAGESTVRSNHGGTGNPDQWRTGNGGDFTSGSAKGRWPANLIHDGSEEVVGAFPNTQSGSGNKNKRNHDDNNVYGKGLGAGNGLGIGGDSGSAARFFYSAKADSDDRLGSKHPTVKPVDFIQYLVRLITPPDGTVLDPFAGTGTTGEAAFREGMKAVLIEREAEYQTDIRRRMALVLSGPDERVREISKAKGLPYDAGPLFNSAWDAMWAPKFGLTDSEQKEVSE